MGDDDLALLDRWCAGDREAGNALFRRHYRSVYGFFQHKIESDAADLVQETFLACLRARDEFRRASSFRTYLFGIARHTLYAYWRRRAVRGDVVDFGEVSIASLSTSAGTRIARGEERARLLASLRELTMDQQLLLELYYWEELERDQLAEVFEVEPATTRSRLFRARQALRERLDGVADRPGPAIARDEDLDAWARSLRPEAAEVRNDRGGEDTTDP
jgi:RNA polymerase sigma factor (sigma-70 family)